MRARARAICLLVVLFSTSANSWAQSTSSVVPQDEYKRLINTDQNIQPLGAHPFGENINLYDGTLSFETIDISVPGTGPALQVGRSLKTANGSKYNLDAQRPFGDWDLDIPRIETFSADLADGWKVGNGTGRCSNFGPPPVITDPQTGDPWGPDQWWYGYHLIVPGRGSQNLMERNNSHAPTSGTYPIVTKQDWMIGCGVTASDGGEGFLVLAPDGTRYTFAHLVYRPAPYVTKPAGTGPDAVSAGGVQPMIGAGFDIIARHDAVMYVTKIEDRFGNTLTYNWTGNNLTSIVGTDANGSPDRQVILTYVSGTPLIQTISEESSDTPVRTWTYSYDTSNASEPVLTAVQLPDGSAWTYQMGRLQSAVLNTSGGDCQTGILPTLATGSVSGSMTAPSGLTATFTLTPLLHGRSYVPKECEGLSGSGSTWAAIPDAYYQFSITQEVLSGPGIPTATWSYSYSPPNASWTLDTCAVDQTCPTTVYTDVADPLGNVTRSTFSNRYDASETELLSTDQYSGAVGGAPLRSTANIYANPTGGPWPSSYGYDPQDRDNHWQTEEISPLKQRTITQDGATFTTTTNSFDDYARPTSITGNNNLGGWTKTTVTNYHDDLNLWVLGQTAQTTVNNIVASQTDYDSMARPVHDWQFGKLISTKAWNADGTLASTTDGNNYTTSFSNWKRGVPQKITYADSTSQSAVVNDDGWLTSVTDENGYTTSYGYDGMGRLTGITYPTGDSVNWNKTLLSFVSVGSTEYGIPAGHWKQTIQTGNAVSTTYFDAFWRPLVTESYDSANKAGTLSQLVKRYDADGRMDFASYPLNNLSDYSSNALTGTHTSYDAIGRVTEVDQDSELSSTTPLKAITQYLSGFRTQVTDPKNNTTTTSYVVFGEPDTSHPFSITSPEGETTTISRDVFDKPLKLIRSGGGVSLTRYYVYDANQQLCKRIDPESGSTVMDYDAAGNLAWSATGLNLPDTTSCDTSSAYGSGRRVDRAYDERNRLTSITYPDGLSNSTFTYAPDGALSTQKMDNGGSPVATTYTYNERRLLTGESLSVPNLAPMSISYGYDANGHLATTTYPDGRNIAYSPNALGQATQAGAYATGVSYFPNGAVKQFTFGSHAVHTMAQNARQLPDRITDTLNGTAGHDEGYDYDANANVGAITDYVSSTQDRNMSYDGLDRLTETDSAMFGGDGKAVYTYDALDNLRAARVGNLSEFNYQYDSFNRLTSLTDQVSGSSITSFSYDVQGNLAQKNNQAYQFDEGNRLRSVPGVASYLYDAAGRRVRKTESASNTVLDADYSKAGALMYQWNPATLDATDYIYLGGTLVAKVVGNQSQVTGHVDGVTTSGADASVNGWACSTGLNQSINVELFAGGPSGAGGIRIGFYTANQPSEPAVATACNAAGANYRFSIPLSTDARNQYAGLPIYMYGDSPVGNPNNELAGSGQYTVPVNPNSPAAPALINVPASSTSSAVTISWAASTDATSYNLQQQANGGAWSQVYTGTETSTTLNLGNGSYAYRVQACNANGCSVYTTSGTLKVAIIPVAPASITVPATSYNGSFTVSWSASSYASSYVLYQSANGGAWTQVYSGSATSHAVTVSASGSYKYEVKACGAGGCSGYRVSGAVAVTFPPGAPSLSGPSSSVSGTFTLSWTAISGATSYQLNRSINGGSWTAVYSGTGRSWSSSNYGNGTYAFRAYAHNAAGYGPASNQITVKVLHVPPAPSSMNAPSSVPYPGNSWSLSWASASGASSYTVQRTNTSSGAVTTLYSTASTTGSDYTTPGTYQYAVKACNSSGCSGWRNASNTTRVFCSESTQPAATQKGGKKSDVKPYILKCT